jgi:hypothetical protein
MYFERLFQKDEEQRRSSEEIQDIQREDGTFIETILNECK